VDGASRVIVRGNSEWPELLDEIAPHRVPDPLFARGCSIDGLGPCVAVVGTRRPTAAGIQAARDIAGGLAEAGFVVVSGLAVGIDAAAHAAALDAGGRTIAVVGCGLDIDYPRRNATLRARIEDSGAVLSEYADTTPAEAWRFPERNRIIAGLSLGVVVIEGAMTSGALITARQALDCNRGVWAVPGSIRNAMAVGPNELIRTGRASLVTKIDHIFEDLAPSLAWKQSDSEDEELPDLRDDEVMLLSVLDDMPLHPDALAVRVEVPPGRASLALASLEVKGLTARGPGGYAITDSGGRARAGQQRFVDRNHSTQHP
jgi:DNA processing protein